MMKPYSSLTPRLQQLQQELEQEGARALETFWESITASGTPLVEPIADDPIHVFLTFLWRAQLPTENVIVFSELRDEKVLPLMTRLGESDLWYLTYRVRHDLRMTYRFSVNDPLMPEGTYADWKNWIEYTYTWRTDPLNPHLYPISRKEEQKPDTRDVFASLLELPAAIEQPERTFEPQARGTLSEHRFISHLQGNERRIQVYTPAGYDESAAQKYPLVLNLNGWNEIAILDFPGILDRLIAAKRIPPLVAVIAEPVEFPREYVCDPSFNQLLAEELLPWLRQSYHVTDDPAQTIIHGSSAGGLAATFAAMKHPEIFGNVLALSGSYFWKPGMAEEQIVTDPYEEYGWIMRYIAEQPKRPLRFYLSAGLLENIVVTEDGPTLVGVNQHLRNVLRAKGYAVEYEEFYGGHELLNWQTMVARGLVALF